MKNSIFHRLSNTARLLLMATLAISFMLGTGQMARAAGAQAPVNLGAAAPFVILTKSGITNIPTSAITGNLGVSPIASTAITGFSLILDSSGTFSRSSQVTGKIYAANYTSPTPSNLTTAVLNMQAAYTNAAGRAIPDHVNLYAGNLSGRTLAPGLYKWSTGVLITTNVTLAGPSNAVWIFQIAGNLTMGSGAKVLLSGGARAMNIFWQVGGGAGAEIGTTAHVEGTILAKTAIHLRTGASLNGRALAQTAVTLDHNRIVIPSSDKIAIYYSYGNLDGSILESGEYTNIGGTFGIVAPTSGENSNIADMPGNSAVTSDENSDDVNALGVSDITFNLGDNAVNKQYRAILHFDTSSLPDTAVITQVVLRIMQQGLVGTNPFFGNLGSLVADIRKPYFGTLANLQISDFQASSSALAVATFGARPVNICYSSILNATGRSLINRTGTTQFRLRFSIDDNNNHIADYMKFYSGNVATASLRPQLVVYYYVP